jgi:hypothetical protein
MQHSLNPGISLYFSFFFLSLCLSLFLFSRREGGKEGMTDCVRERGGAQGRPSTFYNPTVSQLRR